MFSLIKKYKREFVYSSYLFLIFELLVTPSMAVNIYYFCALSLAGYILINSWLISTYKLHSTKKVSKYSDVLLKINIIDRLFTYVVLPLLFYTSIIAFLLFSSSRYINQALIVVSVVLFFYLFLYVRTSYEKVYSVNRISRFSTDFVSIVTYFIFTSVLSRVLVDPLYFSLYTFFITLFFLIYILYQHNKFEIPGIVLALVTSLVMSGTIFLIHNQGAYSNAIILSILYYLVISLWNIRFAGSRAFSDYIPPLMYSIMAIIFVLSL